MIYPATIRFDKESHSPQKDRIRSSGAAFYLPPQKSKPADKGMQSSLVAIGWKMKISAKVQREAVKVVEMLQNSSEGVVEVIMLSGIS